MIEYNPTDIYYMNTIECNQKCSKCSHWKKKDTAQRLSAQKIINAILQIPSSKDFCIVGGEPLLFKNEIVEILKGLSVKKKLRTTIITNGVLLSNGFVNKIKDFNIHIVVSIDTVNKEFWKYVRGSDSMNLVLENFENAVKTLEQEQISIQSVLSKQTEPYLKDVSHYALKFKVFHSIQDYISEGFGGEWTPLDNKISFVPDNEQQCHAAGRNLSIMQNGDVLTCFQQTWINGCEKPLGNLNIHNIEEILSNRYVGHVYKQMKKCSLSCKVLRCNVKYD
jgi:sulfatase maturation enzyme AslB (radical SAM superfamily)